MLVGMSHRTLKKDQMVNILQGLASKLYLSNKKLLLKAKLSWSETNILNGNDRLDLQLCSLKDSKSKACPERILKRFPFSR